MAGLTSPLEPLFEDPERPGHPGRVATTDQIKGQFVETINPQGRAVQRNADGTKTNVQVATGEGGSPLSFGQVEVHPGRIAAAADLDGTYQIILSLTDAEVTALSDAGVNYLDVWFGTESIHTVSPWAPALSTRIDAVVDTTEETQVGAPGNALIVRVVYQVNESGSQTYYAEAATTLRVGGYPAYTAETEARITAGDDLQSITVSSLSALTTALSSQATSDQPLEIVFGITMVRGSDRYEAGDVVYVAPRSSSIERRFGLIPRADFRAEATARQEGDEVTAYSASSGATLATALNAHAGTDSVHAGLIRITADFTTSTRSYTDGERWYIAPHHNAEGELVLFSEAGSAPGGLTQAQQIALLNVSFRPGSIAYASVADLAANLSPLRVNVSNPELLSGDVWVAGEVQGQPGQGARSKWASNIASIDVTFSDSTTRDIASALISDGDEELEVSLRFYDAATAGNEIERRDFAIPVVDQRLQLPAFPAAGSRNGKVPKFNGDILAWLSGDPAANSIVETMLSAAVRAKLNAMPAVLRARGAFALRTAYAVGDVIVYSGHLYYIATAVPASNTATPVDGSTYVLLSADPTPTATETRQGTVEKATQTEMNNGAADKFPDAAVAKTYIDAQAGGTTVLSYGVFPIAAGTVIPNPGSTPAALSYGAALREQGTGIARATGNAAFALQPGTYVMHVDLLADRTDPGGFGHNRANVRFLVEDTDGNDLAEVAASGYFRGGEPAVFAESAQADITFTLAEAKSVRVGVAIATRDSGNPVYTTVANGDITIRRVATATTVEADVPDATSGTRGKVALARQSDVDDIASTDTDLDGIQSAAQGSLDNERALTVQTGVRALQRVIKKASTTLIGVVLKARTQDVDTRETDTTRVLDVATGKTLIERLRPKSPDVITVSSSRVLTAADLGKTIRFTGSAAKTATLPDITGEVKTGWFATIVNDGDGAVTVDGNSTDTINGERSRILAKGQSITPQVVAGTGWNVIREAGFGGGAEYTEVRSVNLSLTVNILAATGFTPPDDNSIYEFFIDDDDGDAVFMLSAKRLRSVAVRTAGSVINVANANAGILTFSYSRRSVFTTIALARTSAYEVLLVSNHEHIDPMPLKITRLIN